MNWQLRGNKGKMAIRNLAFTMIELLVVVSIIVILISLLVPALSTAKATGKSIVCAKNLKQIGQSYNMYVDDNNGWLTVYGTGKYLNLLMTYINPNFENNASGYKNKYKEAIIYHCPSATAEDSWSGSLYSYGQNEHMNSRDITPADWYIQKALKVVRSSETVIFTDTNYPLAYYYNHFSYRHRNGVNIVYFDNHFSWTSQINAINTMGTSNIQCWYGRDSL